MVLWLLCLKSQLKGFTCGAFSPSAFGDLRMSSGSQRTLIGHSGLTQLGTFIIYFSLEALK